MLTTCFNLCTNAQDQGEEEAAEQWMQRGLEICRQEGKPYEVIKLGRLAEEALRFEFAERLYRESLDIAKECENEPAEAFSYRYLGNLAVQRRDYETSKDWYKKALEVYQKRRDMDSAAKCCLSLGNLCLSKTPDKRIDYAAAQQWFRKSLELNPNATWRDRIVLFVRPWRYRLRILLARQGR